MVTEVMTSVKEAVPQVYEAMIAERDKVLVPHMVYLASLTYATQYMADAIAEVDASRVVAVVGMAHMDGIESNLRSKKFELQPCAALSK
jgi:pheromone shutdown protein TraB